MRTKFQIRLPQTIEFRGGKLGFHRSVVLFTVSLISALLLLANTLYHLIEAHAFQSLANSILLILLIANLAWFRLSLDIRTSSSVFLAIFFGQNSLAIMNEYFAFIGLFWASLFPLLAFILKGFRRGLIWTSLMGIFIGLYFTLYLLGWIGNAYQAQALVSLVVNYLLMSVAAGVLWSWNKQLVSEHEESQQLEYLANHDSLTGLLNRTAFLSELEATIEKADHANGEFALLFIDMDCFKAVNDQYGHVIGDKVLTMAAKRLSHSLRATDLIGRYGGDEFLILLRSIRVEDARLLMDKLRQKFQSPFYTDGLVIQIGASIGISYFPQDAEVLDELIKRADREMYRNKLSTKVATAGLKI